MADSPTDPPADSPANSPADSPARADRDDTVARVARTFDSLAEEYDRSGVAFFAPIAGRLCDLLAVAPGERVLDLGCGAGAATLRLAAAAGPAGSVTGVDVSAQMLERTRAAADGLPDSAPVELAVMDASHPTLPEASFDVVAASLVLFFLPDPADALARWIRLLRPGGRIGVTTFGAQHETWAAVDALFTPYLPAALLDPRTRGSGSPFASDEGVERLFTEAGAQRLRTVRRPLEVVFEDAAQWRRWSMGTGQRAFWGFVPEDRREPLFEEAAALLDTARDERGRIVVGQDVRCTLATR